MHLQRPVSVCVCVVSYHNSIWITCCVNQSMRKSVCESPHLICPRKVACDRDMSIYAGRGVVGSRYERVQTLYHSGPQAPRVIKHYPIAGDWWCRQDSNLWPSVPQTDVLSPELRHHQSSHGNSSSCRGSFSCASARASTLAA